MRPQAGDVQRIGAAISLYGSASDYPNTATHFRSNAVSPVRDAVVPGFFAANATRGAVSLSLSRDRCAGHDLIRIKARGPNMFTDFAVRHVRAEGEQT
jgi:hypothetical protein